MVFHAQGIEPENSTKGFIFDSFKKLNNYPNKNGKLMKGYYLLLNMDIFKLSIYFFGKDRSTLFKTSLLSLTCTFPIG